MASINDEAINLLSLDGGGVRGVASLLILHEIMVRIKENLGLETVPKPCEYFHMIGGTSTGGLIAIMLGRLRMSTEEALQEYDQCAKKVFSFRNKKWTRATEKFRATALREVVEDLVRRRGMGDELFSEQTYHDKGHCFVCAMPANRVGEPYRLRSFSGTKASIRYPTLIKIWEAARATTAASYYFKPMPLTVGKCLSEDFIDAAIGCNNPSEYVLLEAADYFGTGRRLGCLISIGTGTRQVKISRAAAGLKNIAQAPKFLKELVGTLKNTATDGEETHRRLQAKLGVYPNAYFRFNVPDAAAEVRLHEYLKIKTLKGTTTSYLSDPFVAARILTAADVLVRNSSEHGLMLGHIHGIDKEQVILSTQEARELGDTSRFFVGREDILNQIDACFSPRDTGGKPRREFLLYGMGGVGKTQIALKAADNFDERFKYIFHIDGTDTQTAKLSYARICEQYCRRDLTGRETTDELKDAALNWIDNLSDEWLMIYDNHPDKERLQPVLPRRKKGNIIYTSRSRAFVIDLPPECVCEVKPLAENDAIALLLKISGNEHIMSDAEGVRPFRSIVAELGYLPLAIEAVGSYIREGDCSAATFLHRFRNRHSNSTGMQLFSRLNSDGSSPARPALYTALDLTYEAIAAVRRRKGRSVEGLAAEGALQALNLLCFYHNERIPVRMIERAAQERGRLGSQALYPFHNATNDEFMDTSRLLVFSPEKDAWIDISFDMGVQMLQRFSLVRYWDRSWVSMHVMVQAWAQDRMDDEIRRQQALSARIVLVESIIPSSDLFELYYIRTITAHANACMAHEAATVTYEEYQALLDFKLGWYYREERQFARALEHFHRTLRICKFEYGVNSRTATSFLSALAVTYNEMGRTNDAEAVCREIIDRLLLRHRLMIADRKAREARERKRLKREARRRKLAQLLRLENQDQPAKAERPSSAAEASDADAGWALTLQRTASAAGESHTGPAPVALGPREAPREETEDELNADLAWTSAYLAGVLYDQGRFVAAKNRLLKSIELLKEADHPSYLEIVAMEDEFMLKFRAADEAYWVERNDLIETAPPDVVDLFRRRGDTSRVHMGVATCFFDFGRFKTAYELYDSYYSIATQVHGPSARATLDVLRRMSLCQLQRGLFAEAERLARTALERARRSYGAWHLETAESLYVLSSVRMCQTLSMKPGSEAWRLTRDAYNSARNAFDRDHYMAVMARARLDRFRNYKPGAAVAESPAGADEFTNALDQIFAKGYPNTTEDFMAILRAELQELRRQRLQPRVVLLTEGENSDQAEAGPSFRVGYSQDEADGAGAGAGAGAVGISRRDAAPRTKKKWKGKQKEVIIKLSPIVEENPRFGMDPAQSLSDMVARRYEEGLVLNAKREGVYGPDQMRRGPKGKDVDLGPLVGTSKSAMALSQPNPNILCEA